MNVTPLEPRADETPDAQVTRYADIAVELGYCPRAKVVEAARTFLETGGDPDSFGATLVEGGIISREQARACERAMRGRSSIGGFAILEKVGQGGMGTVFRARQISMDRIVAVKILAPKFAQDPAFKQRFLNEARTSAKLSHLNIINGIDCGEDCGYTFFAMEFVEGRTAKQILHEKGKLSPVESFAIVRQMADALSYARKFGMVHRDIKPDNIMLTPSDHAKLCDLGLAMQAETEQNEAVMPAAAGNPASGPHLNGAPGHPKPEKKKGMALGTPHYMSPEQARGESNIDARSDIYSLGATWYHFLTGKTLFDGKSSVEVMTHQVLTEAPNPCTLNPEIPRGLGLIISKMVAKAPADRYATADELIADLNAYTNAQPLAAGAFNAKSSCAILPGGNIAEGGGFGRWLPHVAAAFALGAAAYLSTLWFGSKPEPTVIAIQNTNPPDVNKEPKVGIVDPALNTKVPVTPPDLNTKAPPDTGKRVDPATTVVEVPATTTKAPDPTKSPETKAPPLVPPVAPPEVVRVPVVIPPPPPELPKPALKLNADVLYARFLTEVESRAGKMELSKLYKDLRDLSLNPEYNLARVDVEEELKDIKGAHEYEINALKKFAASGVDFEFTPEMARKWGVPKGKVAGFDENRGLSIEIRGGAAFSIPMAQISQELVNSKSQDKSILSQVRYNYANGNHPNVFVLITSLPAPEQKRWQRKSELLIAKEKELTARLAFINLQTVADARSWKTLAEMIPEFQTDYGSTPTGRMYAQQLKTWQDLATKAAQPPSRWRAVFHAASVFDAPNPNSPNAKGPPDLIELIYDFSTPEQLLDFNCPHGALKFEKGKMIVPAGGGEFATVRFNPPFQTIQGLKASIKTLHEEMLPVGVVYVELAQMTTGPTTTNTMMKLDPLTRGATLLNWREFIPPQNSLPVVVNWKQRETLIAFDSQRNGDKTWLIDGKNIGATKVPGNVQGGWIALYGANGNFSVSNLTIVFRPDPLWSRKEMRRLDPPGGDKGDKPPPPPPPSPAPPEDK